MGVEVEGWSWSVRLASPPGSSPEPYLSTILPALMDGWTGCATTSSAAAERGAVVEVALQDGRVASATAHRGGAGAKCLAQQLFGRTIAGDDIQLLVGLSAKDGTSR